MSATPTTQKMPPAYSPAVELAKPHRQEPGGGDQRAGQHRERGRGPGEGRRAHAVPALVQLHHHHLDRDDRVVHQQPERQDQRAQRDALQLASPGRHHHEEMRQRQRHGQRHDHARPEAEREEGDEQHDRQGGDELSRNSLTPPAPRRLVGDLGSSSPSRQLGPQSGGRPHVLAQGQHVDAGASGDADRTAGLPRGGWR